jgi:hypothetical protein
MTQLAHDHESLTTPKRARRLGILLAASLLIASGALFASVPVRADDQGGSGNGGETRGDGSASDHDGIYEAQRGEQACEVGEACGPDVALSRQSGVLSARRH